MASPRNKESRDCSTKRESSPSRDITIPKTNIGFILLQKIGWKEGTGIGAREQGTQAPIIVEQRQGTVGLGHPSEKKERKTDAKIINQIDAEPEEDHQVRKASRLKQVLQAEVNDNAGKEIAKYIYSAFNEEDGPASGQRSSNPLVHKKSKLTASNPLL